MNPRLHVLTFPVVLVLAALAQAQTFTTLYSFTGGSDGSEPIAGVIQDPAGDLYGTTEFGGSSDYGVVFKVNTAGKESVLYSFCSRTNCVDGAVPLMPVLRDAAGSVYGTTYAGGSHSGCSDRRCGTVFRIDTAGNETVLYNFTGGSNCWPLQGLVRDKAGNLYGTTAGCGYGTIFKVDSAGKYTLLHSFTGGSSDGADPQYGHLTMDKSGNLFGVTAYGGASDNGVLYKLSKKKKLTVLYSFAGGTADGCEPVGSVVQDKAGNFYGTTYQCGSSDNGTIWKVSKTGKETVLYNFTGSTSGGCLPVAGVTRDLKGNLYGVTEVCGAHGYGAVYELSAKGKLTLLHSFDDSDGKDPFGEVLRTTNGTLFGTAAGGGAYGYGTVWSYVP